MAVYEFACAHCGPFEVVRPMAEAASPARCPRCDSAARRVFTVPGMPLVAGPLRQALDLEERSAHEPTLVTEKRGRSLPHRHDPTPSWVLSH